LSKVLDQIQFRLKLSIECVQTYITSANNDLHITLYQITSTYFYVYTKYIHIYNGTKI